MTHWRSHPSLVDRFRAESPDDLSIIAHDGGRRLAAADAEGVWVRVTGLEGDVFTGQVLEQPKNLKTISKGSIVQFVLDLHNGTVFPILATEKYLAERDNWTVDPCEGCGATHLFAAPSDLLRAAYPDRHDDTWPEAFAEFCGLCRRIQVIRQKNATPAKPGTPPPYPRPLPSWKVSEDAKLVVTGMNRFMLDLFTTVSATKGNIVVSPSSVFSALSMAYAGAAGETAAEFERALEIQLPAERHHEAMKELAEFSKSDIAFRVSNRIWGRAGLALRPNFRKLAEQCYGAVPTELDFNQKPEEARSAIDEWVAVEANHGLSKGASPSLDSATGLVLANAVHFLGIWQWQFEEYKTKREPFRLSSGDSVEVDMMHQTWEFKYAEGETWQALELPYKTEGDRYGDWVMLLVLPRAVDGLDALERHFERTGLEDWIQLRPREVDVKVPRFRVEVQRDLLPCLSKLGINRAASPGQADFSAMVDNAEGVHLGAATHKAFIEVNEKGTEAGAVTELHMFLGGVNEELAVPFHADRPFLFFIRDRETKAVHFMGRYLGPI